MNNALLNSTNIIDECILDSGDSLWVALTSVLTMVMSPAVGFVYAGLVSAGAMGSMLGFCFAIYAQVTIIWVILGYTLVYGNSLWGLIGNFKYIGLSNLDKFENKCMTQYGSLKCLNTRPYWESCGIPEILILFFQGKFAAITPILFLGSISERMVLKYTLFFITIWVLLIYCPIAHWVWNHEGFLYELGVRDFAGGLVVHLTSGYGALITSIVLGKRKTYGKGPEVSNFPYVILGIMILWLGWFGFNGGSSFSFNRVAVIAILNTNISASCSVVTWLIIDLIAYKRITALGLAMGSISGLVAITPGAGYVDPHVALVFGFVAAFLCWTGVYVRKRFELYDDLDVFTCHGISGTWGVLATGMFATKRVNPNISLNGLFYAFNTPEENNLFILYQIVAILVVVFYTGIVTHFILMIMRQFFNFRTKFDKEVHFDLINFFDEYRNNKINMEVIR